MLQNLIDKQSSNSEKIIDSSFDSHTKNVLENTETTAYICTQLTKSSIKRY